MVSLIIFEKNRAYFLMLKKLLLNLMFNFLNRPHILVLASQDHPVQKIAFFKASLYSYYFQHVLCHVASIKFYSLKKTHCTRDLIECGTESRVEAHNQILLQAIKIATICHISTFRPIFITTIKLAEMRKESVVEQNFSIYDQL